MADEKTDRDGALDAIEKRYVDEPEDMERDAFREALNEAYNAGFLAQDKLPDLPHTCANDDGKRDMTHRVSLCDETDCPVHGANECEQNQCLVPGCERVSAYCEQHTRAKAEPATTPQTSAGYWRERAHAAEAENPEPFYPNLKPWDLEPHFARYMSAMTSEALHSKAVIAMLAWRDQQIEVLRCIAGREICTTRRVDRSYGMDARCELKKGHREMHRAVIGKGHIEEWTGDLCNTTPAHWGKK